MRDDDLRAAFDRLRAASRSTPAPDASARVEALETLARMVNGHAKAIRAAIDEDFGGRSHDETQLLELVPAMRGIRHAQRNLRRWMQDERRPVDLVFQPARAWVRYEPLGVVGIIAPWNYPLLLSIAPLGDALAAGNRAMLKPSELTPRFSDLLARLIAEHFPADRVTVATGGVDVARAVAALPFDHLLFTGSTSVGREVMRAAADHLTPVTLELGGKSPVILAPDYPLAKAAASIAFGKFVNAGQTCIAPDYVLVPQADARRFAQAVIDATQLRYRTIAGNGDYTAIISERHRDRLCAAIEEARAGGAEIVVHGDAARDPARIAPTVVLDPGADSLLMREEIFGPVLPVVGYRTLDEAIAFVAARERPLALYCYSHDAATHARVLGGATSGGVTLNGTLLHIAQDGLPFGGLGPSGMGAYHGRDGFRRFSHARAVYKVGAINVFERLGAPWSRATRMIARWLAR
ncbi:MULTISPECIES: coniferyl aldehyde dehydrogenase [unclassified Aureimonas]|uniref:coniferyl aldehyde dehydrogenase n=1 Tax=unclassified Aureimonas TaxID=2615206 RepID=UPI0006F4175D|nr:MULTISPECIES: coniferyl aldehyde dehydrogenase [unclassified Aureimonas]KQT53942.1 aldehyde dehydrogenase [Aureimonas sp. Leaf427]KQT71618.1 aldehyde dehydrogenase [Aureimonas sp. Leaf460]